MEHVDGFVDRKKIVLGSIQNSTMLFMATVHDGIFKDKKVPMLMRQTGQ